MSIDGKSEYWSEDGSPEEEIVSAHLAAIEADVESTHTTIDVMLANEDKLLTRVEAVCAGIAEQQDTFATAIGKAQSVVGELNTTLTTLSGTLHDLNDAYAGISECAERARHI